MRQAYALSEERDVHTISTLPAPPPESGMHLIPTPNPFPAPSRDPYVDHLSKMLDEARTQVGQLTMWLIEKETESMEKDREIAALRARIADLEG